jgi:NADH-quinone oxidoreductase subunit F
MDIYPIGARATQDEMDAVDAVIGEFFSLRGERSLRGGSELRRQRHLLLPALHGVNDYVGWISKGALAYICARLSIPPAEAYGVATFYKLFSLEPQPRRVTHVCDDIACMVNGAQATAAEASCPPRRPSPCLGMCDHAPAMLVTNAGRPWEQCNSVPPKIGGTDLRLLRRIANRLSAGDIQWTSIQEYRAHGGYQALPRALAMGADAVIAEIGISKLLGRGGAAFPAGKKMEAVARAPQHPHYIICNADESEPGTFKDRVLLENDPFAIIEAMTISGIATGCEHGYIYVRGEYPLAEERLRAAIELALRHGYLGENILGSGKRFRIETRRGAGAYICGEETALFNSIEGRRGEPRNKPPFPAQAGLFGKPTLVNNVETLACIPEIVLRGGKAFASIGTEQSTGTKLFCLSGTVTKPGLYEVPFGTTLRELIDLAGGVRDGRALRAVLLGGAAGTFVGPESLDLPLTFEGTRAAGTTVGSGVVMLFDDRVDLGAIVLRIAHFFREESCGQCVPCRIGTVRQEEALRSGDLSIINDIARAMRDASICGLGQTAANAVESALRIRVLEGTP